MLSHFWFYLLPIVYRFCLNNNNSLDSKFNGFVVKVPYTTNQKYRRLKTEVEIIKAVDEYRKDYLGVIPYVMLQAYLYNSVEVKVVCFNGKAMYEASIDNCNRARGVKKSFCTKQKRFEFAETVLEKMKAVCPSFELSALVRVDILWCDYLQMMVVNEFESLEARFDAADRESDKELILQRFLCIYHANRLLGYLGKHLNQNLELLEYPPWP